MKNKVIKHLKSDIKTFKHEANEDRALIKDISKKRWQSSDDGSSMPHAFLSRRSVAKADRMTKKRSSKPKKIGKIGVVMHEFKTGKLRSGSKKGPQVTNPKQALAIAMSEARKAGASVPRKK